MKSAKIIFGVSVIVSWAVLTAIFVIGFGKMAANNPANTSPQNDSKDIAFAEASNSILGASDVASHNSKSDCWIIMNDKAYDITKYIPLHPGGPGTITPYCGKDAAAAFAGLPHSQYAENLLASYYVGDIGKSIAPAKNTTDNAPDNALPDNSASINPPETAADNPGRTISLSAYEVNRHNSASDCWMIVDNGIYDVTGYVPSHPGGAGAIVSYCGKDGTEAFAGLPHSQYAASILASYYVADLDTAAAAPSVPDPTNTTAPRSLPQSSSTSLSTAEIGAHNSASSCWIILSGKAYDITAYLPYHPGGINTILPYCGGDAALAFSGHSQYANSLLPQYYLGNVGSQRIQNTTNTTPVQPAPSVPNITKPPAVTNPAPSASPQQAHLYTPAEISAHKSASSCWIILNNKAYDVTAYLPYHPGGIATIVQYCGKDAAAAFAGHSQNAANLLASYYLGNVGSNPAAPSPVAPPDSTQPPVIRPNITQPPVNNTPKIITPNTTQPQASPKAFSPAEISTHNSQGSCWMIIGSKVYDATSYLPYHPGGINTILPYCGKDAAAAFAAIGHSSYAQQLLASYYIGELAAAPAAPPNSTVPAPQQNMPAPAPIVPRDHEDDEEEEDD